MPRNINPHIKKSGTALQPLRTRNCLSSLGRLLLSCDLEVEGGLDGLVDLHFSLIGTGLLHGVGKDGDILLVDLDSGGVEDALL